MIPNSRAAHRSTTGVDGKRKVMLAFGWPETSLHRGVAAYALEAGWVLNWCDPASANRIASWRPDGIICQAVPKQEVIAPAIFSSSAAKVDTGGYLTALPSVTPDYGAVGQAAADHFLERGFENFLFIDMRDKTTTDHTLAGFVGRIAVAGFEARILNIRDHLTETPSTVSIRQHAPGGEIGLMIERCLRAQLPTYPQPLAVFACVTASALDVLSACEDVGILVPEQLSLLTASSDEIGVESRFASVPLSVINFDHESQGHEAAKMLDQLMNGETLAERHVLIPPKPIIVRESSSVKAVRNLGLARALRFLANNFSDETLNTTAVVQASGLGRRALYYAFENYIGQPINAEIARLRIERAKTLLADSAMNTSTIVSECGFADNRHFLRTFKRLVGVSLREYRRNLDS